jgi:hypothetical protein
MAQRLRNDCNLPEDEPRWKANAGFVVRNLPWTAEQLHAIPPFEFENWAVIAIGGDPNRRKVADKGIDGRIYPVHTLPQKPGKGPAGFLDLPYLDDWYPIQVKQKDKAGWQDINAFEAVMVREDRPIGFFVSFGYTSDAKKEIAAFHRKTGKIIQAITVQEILEGTVSFKLI